MKKQALLMAVLMCLSLPILAQNNKKVDDRIQLAREKYAEGLSLIAANEPDAYPLNYTSVVRHQNWAAVGPRVDSLQFYYNEVRDDEDEPYPDGYALRMVRYTYNIAARDHFEEYIFDDNEKPLFFFTNFEEIIDTPDGYSPVFEIRLYYDANGKEIRSIYKMKDDQGKMKEFTEKSHPEVMKELDNYVSPDFDYVKGIFDAIY